MKTVLVTGARGFVAKNLMNHLSHRCSSVFDIISVDRSTDASDLESAITKCDIIVHLAGENRPKEKTGFTEGNVNYTKIICHYIADRKKPIIYTSSTQATLENDYGHSKLAAENLLKTYSKQVDVDVAITRMPNVFGKWCKPNYNSFFATMCHNVWNDIPVTIDDVEKQLDLVYIDDVVDVIIAKIHSLLKKKTKDSQCSYFSVDPVYRESLGSIYQKICAIKAGQTNFQITQRAYGFNRALAATFMSYCPKSNIKYPLIEHQDHRGSFYEIFKLADYGQISVSTTKPGITRGNHFHHSKQEKFLVVQGLCCFNFKSLDTGECITIKTSSVTKEVVEVPLGYTHNFTNIGDEELVVLIWCNEEFDGNKPDTYVLEV